MSNSPVIAVEKSQEKTLMLWMEQRFKRLRDNDPERPVYLDECVTFDFVKDNGAKEHRLWSPTGHVIPIGHDGPGARYFDGSTSHKLLNIIAGAAPLTAAPLSMGVWVRVVNNTNSAQILVGIHDTGALSEFALSVSSSATARATTWSSRTSTEASASSTTTSPNGVWGHSLGVEINSASRVVYKNGGGRATNTTSKIPTGIDGLFAGADPNTWNQPLVGELAEWCIYNKDLNEADAAAIGHGMSPWNVRGPSLVFYLPIIGNTTPEIDVYNRRLLAVTGTRMVSNPPQLIYTPPFQYYRKQPTKPATTSAPKVATIGTATLTLTAFPPVIRVGFVRTIGNASLALTAFVPIVRTPRLTTIGAATLTLTAFAPKIIIGVVRTIGRADLVLTAFAPTVLTPRIVTIGVALLALTAFVPVIIVGRYIQIGLTTLTLTAFPPIVSAPRFVSIGLATLTLIAFVPLVSNVLTVTIGLALLVLTAFVPIVSTPRTATIGSASLVLAPFIPIVLTPRLTTIGVALLTLTAFTPNVLASRTATIGLAILTLVAFAPSVSTPRTATIGVALLTLIAFPPNVVILRGVVSIINLIGAQYRDISLTGKRTSEIDVIAEWIDEDLQGARHANVTLVGEQNRAVNL